MSRHGSLASVRVALCQVNPTVGDVAGNLALAARAVESARASGTDLAVLPELCLTGYPPMDLLDRRALVAANMKARDALARSAHGIAVVVGYVDRNPRETGKPLVNAAAVLVDGRVASVHAKSLLPTYDVFEESRRFEPAHEMVPANVCGLRVGVTVCEDAWCGDAATRSLYATDPVDDLAAAGIDLLVNVAASPFTTHKRALRPQVLAAAARRAGVPLVFVNQVGGNDDLVFDGASALFAADGTVLARAHEFHEEVLVADVHAGGPIADMAGDIDAVLDALVLGTRDYARKCGFKTAVIGLSGGIGSALVAWVAAEALSAENVNCVALPSRSRRATRRTRRSWTHERSRVRSAATSMSSRSTACSRELSTTWARRLTSPTRLSPT